MTLKPKESNCIQNSYEILVLYLHVLFQDLCNVQSEKRKGRMFCKLSNGVSNLKKNNNKSSSKITSEKN